MWVCWHLKGAGMSLSQWRKLHNLDRSMIIHEIARRIELHNEAFED